MPLKLFNIRKGEERRTLLMFAYIFLVISSLMIIKPVSHAQFLAKFGARQLPFVFILVAVFAAWVSTFYGRLLGRFSFLVIIRRTLIIFSILLLVVFGSISVHFIEPFVLYVFFVSVSIFAVLAASQFWILANIVFNPREAKRLFGFIGAGGITGGILGGYITKLLVPVFGSENLILLAIAMLLLCIPIVKRIWAENPARGRTLRNGRPLADLSRSSLPVSAIRSSKHLSSLAAIVILSVAAGKFVEYQFVAIASERIADEERLAAFLGFWYSNLNVVSLIVQLFVTRQVVGVFGVGTSLLVLPLTILVGAVGVLVHPGLWPAIFLKVSDGSLKNSIQKSGLELFSLPIPPEIRNPAKSFIDVFGDAFATGVSGLLLLVMTTVLDVPVRYITLVVLLIVGVWLYYVRQLRGEYLSTVRGKMIADHAKSEAPEPDLANESVLGGLIAVLAGTHETKILRTLKMVREIRNDRLVPSFRRLIGHPSPQVRLEALANLYAYTLDCSEEVAPLVFDGDPEIRTEAIQYLFRHDGDDPIGTLTGFLDHEEEPVRRAALLCAARESRNNHSLRNNLRLKERIEADFRALRDLDPEQGVVRKSFCARVIGAAQIPELTHFLHILLRDPSAEVVGQALIAAGQSRERVFLPILMRSLTGPTHRAAVLAGLAYYDPDIIGLLVRWMADPQSEPALRLQIPQIIAQLGTQRAVDVLVDQMESVAHDLRHEIILALDYLRRNHSDLKFNDKRIVQRILEEARLYTETLAVFDAQVRSQRTPTGESGPGAGREERARNELIDSLERKLDQALDTLFKLLGLRYPPEDIESVYHGVRSKKEGARMNAVEFLDNLLDGPVKRTIIPIIESALIEDLVERTKARFGLPIPSEYECLSTLLQDEDPSLVLAALELIGSLDGQVYSPHVCALLSGPDSSIQRKAESTLKELGIL